MATTLLSEVPQPTFVGPLAVCDWCDFTCLFSSELEEHKARTIHSHVIDKTGDKRTAWDKTDAGQVAEARAEFDSLTKKGWKAYRLEGSTRGEVMDKFDASAERIWYRPQMVGG